MDEPAGKPAMSGAYASQRLSFLMVGKACRGKPGSERYSGNPTVADRRGACGNVDASRARRSSIPTTASAPPWCRARVPGSPILQRWRVNETVLPVAHGCFDNTHMQVEYRNAGGKFDRLPALAAELVRLKIDVIVTGGPPSARAAKEATTTIPIVLIQGCIPDGSVTNSV